MGTQLASVRRGEDVRDRVLIRKASCGDKPAMEALYRQYCDGIYQSCLRICREPEDAIDAMQDTFMKVFRRLEELDPETLSFRDYLFTSARNACFKVISKRKRVHLKEKIPEQEMKITDDAHSDPERSLMIEEQQKMVRNASTELSTRHYQALVMYELDGFGYAEIGKQLDLDANAVGQLILRARRRLRREVRRRAMLQTDDADDGTQCTRALALLPRKAEGRLDKRGAKWLDSHLETCEACATNLSLMQEVGAGYRAVLPPALIGLLWLRISDALANTGYELRDRVVTLDESKNAVANSGSGQGLETAGELRTNSANSRHKRSKRVVALTCLIIVPLAVVVACNEYLLKEDSRTGSSGKSSLSSGESSLLHQGIGQLGTPTDTDGAQSLGITDTGRTSSTNYKEQSVHERIDDRYELNNSRSSLEASRSKTGTDNGREGRQSKPRQNPRSSGEDSSGTSPVQSVERQEGVEQTSDGSGSSNQKSSSTQQEYSASEAIGLVPKARSLQDIWPIPHQIQNNTPSLPSIRDVTKPKLPARHTVKPKEEFRAPCKPWPQCLRPPGIER